MALELVKVDGSRRFGRWKWLAAAGAVALMTSPAMGAMQGAPTRIEIPSQALDTALLALSRQANVDIVAPAALTRGKSGRAVSGPRTVETALAALLDGTGLVARKTGAQTYTVVPFETGDAEDAAAATGDVVITGSRIRGAPPTSPVITVTQEEMRNSGHSDLGQVIRSIPQNFTGGQNPGIGTGGEAGGSVDLNGTSNLNLRGLGPAATLTLLNGRRLAYGGVNQGVDISAIPLAAVERIEIVADGASALYGSDAVGGVANVILKGAFDGVEATALVGGATDGGFARRQVSATTGRRWGSGRVLIAGGFDRWSDITADQRSYTEALFPTATIYPNSRNWNVLGSLNQSLTSSVKLSIDSLYNSRSVSTSGPFTTTSDASENGSLRAVHTSSFLVSPTVEISLPGNWQASLSGTHGRDQTDQFTAFYIDGAELQRGNLDYGNRTTVVELNAEGPLFAIMDKSVRLAVGGGFRAVGLTRFSRVNDSNPVEDEWSQDSYYAYAEILVPIVSPKREIPGVHSLSLSGAIRYENYENVADVATPKVGLTYAPSRDMTLSATWGKSFKTPTLFDLNGGVLGSAISPSSLGGTGFPETSTAIFLSGRNPSLQPERSTNWTISAAIHPAAIDGARLEFSYFVIDYRERIVEPIASFAQALSNPIYAQFITYNPLPAQVGQAIASANNGFNNLTGRMFDPSTVVAIVDARLQNVARQRGNGIDISAFYRANLGDADSLSASIGATYLRLRNQVSSNLPTLETTGTLFNPPHWRARAGVTWDHDPLTLSSHANYIGTLADVRPASPDMGLNSQITFDATAAYRVPLPGIAQDIRMRLSALNLFNAKPERIWVSDPASTPFDSVNYSAIGRQITLSASVVW